MVVCCGSGFIDQWLFTTFPGQAWIQYDLFSAKVSQLALLLPPPCGA